jgi:hypothetical protein
MSSGRDRHIPSKPYELGGNLETVNFVLYRVYRREAYLRTTQGNAPTAVEFRKIFDYPGAVRGEPIGALAHVDRGRALVLSEDEIKAQTLFRGLSEDVIVLANQLRI